MRIRFLAIIIALFALLNNSQLISQIVDPVKWSFAVEKISEREYYLFFNATIAEKWHLYAQEIPVNGPVPTSFTFTPSGEYEKSGKVDEVTEAAEQYDGTFGMNVKMFDNKAVFRQRVKILTDDSVRITGYLEFMSCDDSQCTPPTEIDFSFKIEGKEPARKIAVQPPVKDSVRLPERKVSEPGIIKTDSIKPVKQPAEKVSSAGSGKGSETIIATGLDAGTEGRPVPETVTPEVAAGEEQSSDAPAVTEATGEESDTGTVAGKGPKSGLWRVFWIAFLGGLAAILTPCVFPMIPLTVSFFTKQSKTRAAGISNGLFYGFSIIVIYVILGTIVTTIFGADSLNILSTNPWMNLFFALLLIVFAISFFGAFELTLPSKWVNAADRKAEKRGLAGIFFMAFTLALVSFSCTGPIVGALIVQAASVGGIAPVIGMFGFSLAMALPFALFAAFPGYLNSLPKSGGWLNSVKVVLAFLELAFAIKFLSIADMVLDLRILTREVFIASWIVIFGGLGFYLLGKIRLPHDSKMEHLSVTRLLLGLSVLIFTVYMIPGLWGAPVNLISGFPPPTNYAESPFGVGRYSTASQNDGLSSGMKVLPPHMHYGPQGISSFDDYDLALEYAMKVNKPLLLDFTGKGCTNCRKMEDMVWSNQSVKDMLTNDFVLVSLYVDFREPLPEDKQYISSETGRRVRTIGHKWSDFQITRFHKNSQPHYVIMDHYDNELVESTAYNPDIRAYIAWLKSGLRAYGNLN